MALTREQKKQQIDEVSQLLGSSRMTVMASYQGTTVKALQELRRSAAQNGTTVRVVKNRLFKMAAANLDTLKDTDTSAVNGQLLYAFNSEDEVAPAQTLADFAKKQPQIKLVTALSADGQLLSEQDVKALAALPNKHQLRGMLAGTLAAPLSGFVNTVAGNVRGVLNVLNARAEQVK